MPDDFMFDEEDTGTSFNPEEFSDEELDAQIAAEQEAEAKAAEVDAAQVTASIEALTEAAGSLNMDYMDDVQVRLDIASYYRELLSAPVFGDDSDPAQIVEEELRQFATERLQVLMGIKQGRPVLARPTPPQKLPFDEAEVASLKALVALVPQLSSLVDQFDESTLGVMKEVVASVLKRRETTPPPAAETKPKPVLRPRAAPVPAAPPAPAPKPVPPPRTVVPPAPAPRTPPKPAARPAPPPAAPAARPRPAGRPVIARRGRAPAPPVPAAPTQPAARPARAPRGAAPAAVPAGPSNEVPRPQSPAGMVPFPSRDQMTYATAALAGAQAASGARLVGTNSKQTVNIG